MSMMVSFVLSFFPRDVLDEILNLIESVSEDFPSYSLRHFRLYRVASQKEKEKDKRYGRREKVPKQPPSAPTESTVGPCLPII